MPPLVTEWGDHKLWPAQITAIRNLEASLAQNKPRALIQMATGSGKTFTAISFIYRLIKFAGARRVLFLVDRGNLGRQTKKEFDQYVSPVNNYKFGEEYIVQHLTSNQLDKTARVCISTIQRMYSMLKGRELPEEADEESTERVEGLFKEPEPIDYNPAFPIETFDIIVTDEAHRSIYNLWRQVLEYFDAYLIGLTATPNKQTFGFFNQNLVMEYGHPQAVADGVNVNYDVYRIKTEVTEAGSTVEAGYWLQVLDKPTRARRDWQLDDDFEYAPEELDRSVQTPDQIRTIARTLRDRWQTDLFPQRQELPKTLVFAKDDNHAEAIVGILREEWGRGNEFAQKITYRTTGSKPEELIKAFRTSYYPRIAVTVDMIATGTDIKPVEIVVFMRSVKSRSFFEQMKGRGVRVIKDDDLRGVNPGEHVHKDHFVIVDCVGVCERDKTDSRPMDQKKSVPLDALLQAVSLGNVEPEVLSSVAVRLARLDAQLTDAERAKVVIEAGGMGLKELSRGIVQALRPARGPHPAGGRGRAAPGPLKPLSNPALRELILDPQAAEGTGDRHRHPGPRARSRLLRGRARARAGHRAELRSLHRPAPRRDHRAADPLQPPDQGAAEVRRPEGAGRHAAGPAAPVDRKPALAGLRRAGPEQGQGREPPPHPDRPRLTGALRDAPGERAGALPRARGRQLQGVDGAAAGGWEGVHRRAALVAGEDGRAHRQQPRHRGRGLRLRAVRPARRAGQGASALRGGVAEGDR
ncbi:MAG: DEAD/DEAH box helicase family protein [Burkholderiaceae bacterium]|nr:DEAD/DEAH box helicase family protein [Burkholderiaceae bacterium]